MARKNTATRIALLVLCGSLLAPASWAVSVSAPEKVNARNQRLKKRFKRASGLRARDHSEGISADVQVLKGKDAEGGTDRFVLRHPHRGIDDGVRKNNALQVLAVQMNEERMVPGAIAVTYEGRSGMLMSHVGTKYVGGMKATAKQCAAVDEHQRLVGATIDVLSRQIDRKNQNVLVHSSEGKARLIDPDNTFGSGHRKGWIFSSPFVKGPYGNKLAYASAQNSITDLPSDIQQTVVDIAAATVASLVKTYGLEKKQAGSLKKQAQVIKKKGLDAAVAALQSEYRVKDPKKL